MNNGFSSGWFQLTRGVRQGCPLSCILFIVCVEILANLIRQNDDVKGVDVNGEEIKLSQFADDTNVFVTTERSIYDLFQICYQFEDISGLRLNTDKSKILWIGPWRKKRIHLNMNIEIVKTNINVLGIEVGYDKVSAHTVNFDNKINRMSRQLNMWTQRNLTILGKILIVKTFGLSNLVYSFSTQTCNQPCINKIQKSVNKFIWQNKPPKVKHTTMIGPYDEGGVKAPDLESQKRLYV